MGALDKAYNGITRFVDSFVNTTTSDNDSLEIMENKSAWYAEWDDNYFGELLNNKITKTVLRKVADTYYGKQLEDLLSEATELTSDSFPRLFDIFNFCCITLGVYCHPKAYVTGRLNGINAISLDVHGKQLILISSQAAVCLSTKEQCFLLGHEISHHQQGNLVCHTVNGLVDNFNNASSIFGPLVLDSIEVPLKRWCRQSEFNADRAGYLCCNDLETIKRLFIRLGMISMPSVYADYNEVGAAHPMLHTRWKALKDYIQQTQI